jgi:DNA repair exonuclease SbcCD ATPase subunit
LQNGLWTCYNDVIPVVSSIVFCISQGMIKKINLIDFMAHKATNIELAPGVTVITGPNNIGKSAIVEAMRYLVANPAPKNVIRHGASKALVSLELDSGEIITWQRLDKSASYSVQHPAAEPEEYHKFGREVPADVRSLLRLDEVKTDAEDIDIHLGNQRQPIFLLDRPGSQAAAFFAASSEVDYLLKMQQALKRRIDVAKSTRKALDLEIATLASQLHDYEPLDDLESPLAEAEALYGAILTTAQHLPVFENLIHELREEQTQLHQEEVAAAVLEVLADPPGLAKITGLNLLLFEMTDKMRQHRLERARAAELNRLASPPDLKPVTPLEALIQRNQDTQRHYEVTQDRSRILADLVLPSTTVEVERLRVQLQSYQESWQELAALRHLQTALTPMTEPPKLEETAALEDLGRELRREQARQDRLDRSASCLNELQTPPETTGLQDLEASVNTLMQARAELSLLQADQEVLAVRLDEKQLEIQRYLQDTGACPLCGSPLDLEHFLENRHV